MTREETLKKAHDCVCQSREQDYGSPEDSFKTISQLWTAYLGHDISSADVTIMMALLKIARLKGGHFKEDSFVDLAGYAACGAEIATEKGKVADTEPNMPTWTIGCFKTDCVVLDCTSKYFVDEFITWFNKKIQEDGFVSMYNVYNHTIGDDNIHSCAYGYGWHDLHLDDSCIYYTDSGIIQIRLPEAKRRKEEKAVKFDESK